MIRATLTVMALILRRDRPTLALTFLLPPIVFLVFTAVFKETSSHVPTIQVAMLDKSHTVESRRIIAAISGSESLRARVPAADDDELRSMVTSGTIDVGVVIRAADPVVRAGRMEDPVTIVSTPSHSLAARIVMSQVASFIVQDTEATPTKPERLTPSATATVPDQSHRAADSANFIEHETVGDNRGDLAAAGEVGAIASMFLMLAAIQIAATLVDERESGIYDRVASSGEVDGLVLGKFVFGVSAGCLQAAAIVLTAAIAFDVDVLASPTKLAITCCLTAAVASSLTLSVAACCSTRHQTQSLSTFAVLILSTIGGSMVPLNFMPPWLAKLGWLTPNAWSIEAFDIAFRREGSQAGSPLLPWFVMASISATALWFAICAFRRRPLM